MHAGWLGASRRAERMHASSRITARYGSGYPHTRATILDPLMLMPSVRLSREQRHMQPCLPPCISGPVKLASLAGAQVLLE